MLNDSDLDEIRLMFKAKISMEDIAVFFNFDSMEDFMRDLNTSVPEAWQKYFSRPSKGQALSDRDIDLYKKEIEEKKNSPERRERILLKNIKEYAESGGSVNDLIKFTGMSEENLDEIIVSKKLGFSFKEFIEQYHAKHRLDIQKELSTKAKKDKDGKTLQFLAEKLVEDLKEAPKDTIINLNQDNRKVIMFPEKKDISKILEQQKQQKKLE